MSADLLLAAADWLAKDKLFVMASVVRTSGSTPRSSGARMLVAASGETIGSIGGGRVEYEIIKAAKEILAHGKSQLLEFELTQDLAMCCGGQMSVFVEVIQPAPQLVIFGAGHVGCAVAELAARTGFAVFVVDEREDLLTPARLPQVRRLFDDHQDAEIPLTASTYVLVATHDHQLDQRLVERCLQHPHQWLGLIASRRKAELTRQRLRQKNFSEPDIAHVRAPVGLDIAAETPEEIAVSILAELIAHRRKST